MKTYAHVENGLVTMLFASGYDATSLLVPADEWVEITDLPVQPQVGWAYDGQNFVTMAAPTATLDSLLLLLDARTQAAEAAGIMFQAEGATAPALLGTDPLAQGKLTSAFVAASAGLWTSGTPWKFADGTFVPFTAKDAMAAAGAALGYVAKCAAAEAALAGRLAGNLALDTSDPALWPANGPFSTLTLTSGGGSAAADPVATAAVDDAASTAASIDPAQPTGTIAADDEAISDAGSGTVASEGAINVGDTASADAGSSATGPEA